MPKDRISVVGGGVGQLFLKLAFLILILEHVSSSSTSHPISNSALHEKDVNKPRPTDEDEAEAGSASQQQAKVKTFGTSTSDSQTMADSYNTSIPREAETPGQTTETTSAGSTLTPASEEDRTPPLIRLNNRLISRQC
ncbi:hypothetical protein F5887DRAFT_272184 [Amanita rubescens]|nr:hypothetical protein F5887DRAFT_272184 [Amanita rubescens]